jgi:acetyltransferase-like isoleucine patch superfamily enzyme
MSHRIGRHSYIVEIPEILYGEQAHLEVGNFCSIARGFRVFLGGNHLMGALSTFPFSAKGWKVPPCTDHPSTNGNIVIGNDVWIGRYVTIMSGSNIGDGAVIGACSVVAGDIGDYELACGNPARMKKKRFSDEDIKLLKSLRWWNWPDEKIAEANPILMSGDVSMLAGFARGNGL